MDFKKPLSRKSLVPCESSSSVTLNIQTNEYRNMRNISLQTGEEFLPEFPRDRVSGTNPFADNVIVYKDPTCKDYRFDQLCNSKRSANLDSSFSGKIKFLCSFGGQILSRPNDSKLRYVGGDTRIVSVKKELTFNELMKKTTGICNYQHTIKYQLPGEDLDALISVSSDEDLLHMIDEYSDLERKSQRLRIFLVSNHESLESPSVQKETSSSNLLTENFSRFQFQPPLLYIRNEKSVSSQDTFSFTPVSVLHANEEGGFASGERTENTSFSLANKKYQMSGNNKHLSQEPRSIDRDYIDPSLGLYSGVFPETTTNDDLGGNVQKENAVRIFLAELDIKNGTSFNSQSSEKQVIDEHSDESGSVGNAYENDDDNVSIHDSAFIEKEANIYGLQIIKNNDLEELQELGSGTFGKVYHGKWRGTDVAIKRIKKSCFSGGAYEKERLTKDFWREAKILSRIHHPNIVAFYGVVADGPGGTLATVSEYMANGSLRHVLSKNNRALDRHKKAIIALDASFEMEYLHLKNIVHFDLKCDNLLINLSDSQRPICKVTDFGLSRIKQSTLVSGGVRGTLPWMAPELLNGNSICVSENVDVFSFGITLWEILTGEEPYIDMHCGAIIGGIVKNTLRPKIPERCDPNWRNLMEECWSYDPARRPSFTEITKRLQTISTKLQPKRFTSSVRR